MEQFLQYVGNATGLPVAWEPLVQRDLPAFLRQAYELAEVAIGEHWLLAIVPRKDHSIQPTAFEKQVPRLQKAAHRADAAGYCLIADDIPAYVRKRLIERRIPFVVPGREMFLPQIGHVARKRRNRAPVMPAGRFPPSTQAVFMLALVQPDFFPARPLDVADRLGLATMTVSRAFNGIEAAGLGNATRKGYERWLGFTKPAPMLWQDAIPYLYNPVRETRRILLADLPVERRVEAGETALAGWTLLLPPPEPVFAIASRDWKHVVPRPQEIPIAEPGTCRVQLWRYDPRPLAGAGRVDRFSLWLSLEQEQDERVQAAREKLMEDMTWSQD
ncbi:MAG TPA: transcriptional regulator [Gammaproteobacteria bacterium]